MLIVLVPSLDNEAGRTDFFTIFSTDNTSSRPSTAVHPYAYDLARDPSFELS